MNRYQRMSDKSLLKLAKFYIKNNIFGVIRTTISNEVVNRILFKKISTKDKY